MIEFNWPLKDGPAHEGRITQWFAENPGAYRAYNLPGHDGIDFWCGFGWPVINPFPSGGRVVESASQKALGYRHNYGLHVRLETELDGHHFQLVLAHLSSSCVSIGDIVAPYDIVGLTGNSGNVRPRPTPRNPKAGTHLHVSLKDFSGGAAGWPYYLIDPRPFFFPGGP